jgi:hypothetical protein
MADVSERPGAAYYNRIAREAQLGLIELGIHGASEEHLAAATRLAELLRMAADQAASVDQLNNGE